MHYSINVYFFSFYAIYGIWLHNARYTRKHVFGVMFESENKLVTMMVLSDVIDCLYDKERVNSNMEAAIVVENEKEIIESNIEAPIVVENE